MATTAQETTRLAEIEAVIFPAGARTQNARNDAEIAFNAGKYRPILITADSDLLRCRAALGKLGIRVVTDEEAVEMVERRIVERDERARRLSVELGLPLREWVGQDLL